MPIIDQGSLATHMYAELISEITRENNALADTAIANAEEEARLYLSRYDLLQLFGEPTEGSVPAFISPLLASIVKDIAVWHIIKLANPGVNYEHIRKCYDEAIAKLKEIQSGVADPRWPYLKTDDISAPPGISVSIHANPKRNNDY